jgi:hypothetical protein
VRDLQERYGAEVSATKRIAEARAMSKRFPSAAEFDVTLLLELLG